MMLEVIICIFTDAYCSGTNAPPKRLESPWEGIFQGRQEHGPRMKRGAHVLTWLASAIGDARENRTSSFVLGSLHGHLSDV